MKIDSFCRENKALMLSGTEAPAGEYWLSTKIRDVVKKIYKVGDEVKISFLEKDGGKVITYINYSTKEEATKAKYPSNKKDDSFPFAIEKQKSIEKQTILNNTCAIVASLDGIGLAEVEEAMDKVYLKCSSLFYDVTKDVVTDKKELPVIDLGDLG